MLTTNEVKDKAVKPVQTKLPIGQLLKEAGLISEMQLELALQNQTTGGYAELKVGEILALRGWVKQETTDFFVSCWEQVTSGAQMGSFKQKIGDYLYDAHLLDATQIDDILQQQRATKILFGKLAVTRGYIKQETLDFFVKHLFPVSQADLKAETHLNRAQIFFGNKDTKNAVIELRLALQLAPNNYKCHTWLAKIYFSQNQVSLAKVHLKKAMQINANDDLVKELAKKMSVSDDFLTKKTKFPANKIQKTFFTWLSVL